MTDRKLIEGKAINLGGTEYIVPPLNLGQIRRLQKEIESIGKLDAANLDDNAVDTMLKIIHTGLSRNYPEMKKEQLEDLVDLGNLRAVTEAVLGVSGLKKE